MKESDIMISNGKNIRFESKGNVINVNNNRKYQIKRPSQGILQLSLVYFIICYYYFFIGF